MARGMLDMFLIANPHFEYADTVISELRYAMMMNRYLTLDQGCCYIFNRY